MYFAGTRETATKKTQAEVQRDKAEAEKQRKVKQQDGVFGMLRKMGGAEQQEEEGGLSFSCGNLCKVCLHKIAAFFSITFINYKTHDKIKT